MEEMHQIAKKRGGKCLSGDYINAHRKLLWKCNEGHTWRAVPNSIKSGTWCPICAIKKRAEARKLSIREMHNTASEKGGYCLSETYISAHDKLLWQCAEGHQWEATPSGIRSGSWCPTCSSKKRGASQRLSIEDMAERAKERGGKCLSDEYINARTKLLWQCAEGHQWEATPDGVKSGHWCPECMSKRKGESQRLSIKEINILAKKMGGKCLSDDYKNARTKLIWECAEGHRWKAAPYVIKAGHWCPTCGGTEKLSISDMRQIAQNRGGKCLSDTYVNAKTKIEWQCSEGHKWKARPEKIKSGRWCPYCSSGLGERICRTFFEKIFKQKFPKSYPVWLINKNGNQMELDGFCEKLNLAFEHHGEHHYSTKTHYIKSEIKLKQRQKDDRLKRELCKAHNVALVEIPELFRRLPIEEIKGYLKKEFKKLKVNIPNDFYSKRINLKSAYTTSGARQFLNELNSIALNKGGKCLSNRYINDSSKLLWQCAEGHEWEATPNNIKHGKWCPVCARNVRLTIQEMQRIAKEKGGTCLSSFYLNNRTKLLWQCAEGHQWEATADGVKSGHWCPICGIQKRAKVRKLSIEEMKKIAIDRDGKCLSKIYINARAKLLWQCAKGHKWEATPDKIKRGSWCPICGRKRAAQTKKQKKSAF